MKRIILLSLVISFIFILPAFAQNMTQAAQAQSLDINNADFLAYPKVRSIEINNADFISYPKLRSVEIKSADFIAVPKIRSFEVKNVDFVAKVTREVIDLSIIEIKPPKKAISGTKALIYVSVKNLSNVPVKKFEISLSSNDGFGEQKKTGPIAVGETKKVSFEWPMQKPGSFRLSASVEAAGDSSPQNNTASITVEVKEKPASKTTTKEDGANLLKTKVLPTEKQ